MDSLKQIVKIIALLCEQQKSLLGHLSMPITLSHVVIFLSSYTHLLIKYAGPEGSKTISYAGSTIVHTFADLLSKNLWGFIANYLRVCIHKHIIMYGDLRKKVKVQVAGQEMELEQYQDEQDDETIKYSTDVLASRNSFIQMRDQMQAQVIS